LTILRFWGNFFVRPWWQKSPSVFKEVNQCDNPILAPTPRWFRFCVLRHQLPGDFPWVYSYLVGKTTRLPERSPTSNVPDILDIAWIIINPWDLYNTFIWSDWVLMMGKLGRFYRMELSPHRASTRASAIFWLFVVCYVYHSRRHLMSKVMN
jgi:hypothetical protein